MQHKRILSVLIAFLFFGRITHLQATQSNLSSKDKKVVLPTLALMFLHNKLNNLNSDTTKDNLQIKRVPFSKRPCLDGAFQPLHTLPSSLDDRHELAKDILTPRPGDKVRLITGKVAQVKAVAPITKNNKGVGFSYTVTLSNKESIKGLYDERLAGLQSRLARCERQLALGDVVLVKNDAKIVILDGVEDDLKPLDTKEITLNPGFVQKANPIGKVVYLDGDWVGLIQANPSLSLPLKNKTNKKHSDDEKVEDNALDQQQLGTKQLSQPTRWFVPTSYIRCILDREKRYKVYERKDKDVGIRRDKKDLGLRYPLAARSPMGSVIYQTSSSKFMRRMAYFTDSFNHKVLLQGNKSQVLGTEQELLLPAHADDSLPSPLQALASGKLTFYNFSKKDNVYSYKERHDYTYTLQPTAANYTAKLSLWRPYDEDKPVKNFLLPKNTATQVFFWCHKRYMPCRYGLVVTQSSQPWVLSFDNERSRRIFYSALVWLTSPYVLAIEEVNNQPTRQTRLLACADTKQMTLQQLAHYMENQWLVREGTLHQNLYFLDPHFIFKKHQQQSLSKYYDWSLQQRYKKVYISLYRTSKNNCMIRFGRYPQLGNQDKISNICPDVAKSINGNDTFSLDKLHTEACEGRCMYVDYLSGQHNHCTFDEAKDHMDTYYHGRQTPCFEQSKCSYNKLTTPQAQCHRLLYSHAPRRTRVPQNLSNNYSPFKSQEDPDKARKSQCQPSQLEVQGWDSTHGYLQPFMHEQISNGYLFRWAGKGPNIFRPYEGGYKNRLGYKKYDPSTLKLSLDCLPLLKIIKKLFLKPRHQHMGYPLTLAELAAIYAYTAWDNLCSDFNRSFRQEDYHKWRWMDGLLHKAITKLSFLEDGDYPLYTGFKNIRLNKTRQSDQRWSDYTSSTPYPVIATTFHQNNGMQIAMDPSMRKSKHVPCCDVSWISPYPEEYEVLFARGTAGHSQSSTVAKDDWKTEVTGQTGGLQQIRIWHDVVLKQVPNHPLPMSYQLFGASQMLAFATANYHQLSHKLLLGQWINANQRLGVGDDRPLLYISAQNGHKKFVKRLLQQPNININLQTDETETSLFIAAKSGHIDVVEALLKHNHINVNLQNKNGWSALHAAAEKGHMEVVELLLDHPNINVNLHNKAGSSALYMAAENGHTEVVRLLLEYPDTSVDLQRDDKKSLFWVAAQNGHTDIVGLLLSHTKVKVNLQRDDGISPLWMAAQQGHTAMVTLLLNQNDIDVNWKDENDVSPLLMSAQHGHTDIVKLLLGDPKIKVNLQNDKGTSPLFMAATNGHTDIVKLLLRHPKIKVNLQNDKGTSALFMAAKNGHTDIVKLLLAQPGIQVNLATQTNPQFTLLDVVYEKMNNTQDSAIWEQYHNLWQLLKKKRGELVKYANNQPQPPTKPSLLFVAAFKGYTSKVEEQLKQPNINVNHQRGDGASALLIAAQEGHTDIVRHLLKHPKINVNLQRNDGASALSVALEHGHTAIVTLLLYHDGINVNLQTDDGASPLFIAAQQGHTDVVRALLQKPNINVNLQRDDSTSPLFIAAQQGHTDVVKALLQKPNINIKLQNNDGWCGPHAAENNGHTDVVKALLQKPNININLQNNDGWSGPHAAENNGHTDVVKALLQKPNININLQNNDGWSVLHIAANNVHNDVVKALLQKPNININLQNNDGWSALHATENNVHNDVVKALPQQPNININLQNNDGWSALHAAAKNGHTYVVRALLQQPNININLQNNDGWSALHAAAKNGHTDVVRALLQQPNININLQNNDGWSPLYIAATNGHIDVIMLLLEQPSIKNLQRGVPLAVYDELPLHTIPDNQDTKPRKNDKIRLTTGRLAQITAVAISSQKHGMDCLYTVSGRGLTNNSNQVKAHHLAGFYNQLASYENRLALGDIVLVQRQKLWRMGRVVYIDQDWIVLAQADNLLPSKQSLLHANQHNNMHKLYPTQDKWVVYKREIACILEREKRYKVYEEKHGEKDLGLRYPLATRRPVGSLIYQDSTSQPLRIVAYAMEGDSHKMLLLQGKNIHVLGTEDDLLLPAFDGLSRPSTMATWASGRLSLYTLSSKLNTNKAWTSYAYTLQPTTTTYTASLSLCVPDDETGLVNNHLLSMNSACQPLFWCDKRRFPCRYGLTLTQTSQQMVLSFVNERDRRIFYTALVWLTSPHMLAIEEVTGQPTGQTRLLSVDINTMTIQQLAHHMKTQRLSREGTLHQQIHFLDPYFTFTPHQQQSLSEYYDWSSNQRYKRISISFYRTSQPDCIAHFGKCPRLNNQGKTANICPTLARSTDGLKNEEDLSVEKLHTQACQNLCPYVGYLAGNNNDYSFEQAKEHMTNHYHGRPTPCPEQPICKYNNSKSLEAQRHRLLYSHAPRRTRNAQTLSSNYSPFKSQEDPYKARRSQYQPSLMEVQCWDTTNGYLQPFMHEQIKNNYLYLWTSHQSRTFCKLEPYYKKLLAYNEDNPSALNISSLNCLTLFQPDYKKLKDNAPNLYRLFYSPRHQRMGYPLTLAELAALYAYTAWNELCSDFNKALRDGDYHKWRWMDGLLHKAITTLSFLENGCYTLYTGFRSTQLTKARQSDQRWQDYTSSTPYPAIAEKFTKDKDGGSPYGIMITIDPSMRQSTHVPCCDVSWISPYPEEYEVLFARGTAGHVHSTTLDNDGWEVSVTGQKNQLQKIKVWHKDRFQQYVNHPLPMIHQLFGSSQRCSFQPPNYHQLIHKRLSNQFVAVNQELGGQQDSPLLYIAAQNGHTDLIKALLKEENINPNLQNSNGTSSLHIAAQHRHTEVIQVLLQHKNINVNLKDEDGKSPLHIAAFNGHADVVKLLLRYKNINANLQDKDGSSPLHIAAQNGHTKVVKTFIQHLELMHPAIDLNLQANDKTSPLYMAVQKGYTTIVKLLLGQSGIQVNLATRNPQTTPLDAVYEKMKDTQDPAVWDTYHAIWQLLKEQGAQLVLYAHHQPQPPQIPSSQKPQSQEKSAQSLVENINAQHSDEQPPTLHRLKNVQLTKTRQSKQRWQDYTSSSCYPAIAIGFHENNGLQITIDPSMRKSKHVPCCDVS